MICSCSEKGDGYLENYKEQRKVYIQRLNKKEMVNDFALTKELESQFKSLSNFQKQSLLEEELVLIKNTGVKGLGPSGMVVFRDSSDRIKYKCGTIDYSPVSVAKIFENKTLFYDYVFPQTYYIPIRWYVINEFKDSIQVSESDLQDQLDVLNQAFDTINIQFFTHSNKWRTNAVWYKALKDSKNYYQMIDSLSKEPTTAINVFVTNQDSLLGAASFPWDEDRYQTIDDHILLKDTTFKGRYDNGNLMLGKISFSPENRIF